MTLSRNQQIAGAFAARARDYERNAALQADVAEKLAQHLPGSGHRKILEIGCGTGFLTRHLLARYPHGDFLLTDLAPEMVMQCRARYSLANGRAIRFAIMDGEAPDCTERFDLIALSMTLQWFADPLAGLQRLRDLLRPGGTLVFSAPGPGSFPEWRAALEACGLRRGVIEMPQLPGVVERETRKVEYGNAAAFLNALKAIGAATPRAGYDPLPPGSLRAALRKLEQDDGARVSWRIVYGVLCAPDRIRS
ncbi:MAG TPA: methyltransferase domain-containing protein [Rhizobiales bacterium]|nr:malonyl-[acyl-carrier protein] O-methyltransferase [bacterium BMS3Bbin10]HDO52614.1 methyltransferase domain-containing protein [Hyphomicrobiales bacterium]